MTEALDQLLMDLGAPEVTPPGKALPPEEADRVLVEVPGAGRLVHPLPLPAGQSPEEWIAELAAACQLTEGSRWCLAAAAPHRSGTPTPLQAWCSVPTASSP